MPSNLNGKIAQLKYLNVEEHRIDFKYQNIIMELITKFLNNKHQLTLYYTISIHVTFIN